MASGDAEEPRYWLPVGSADLDEMTFVAPHVVVEGDQEWVPAFGEEAGGVLNAKPYEGSEPVGLQEHEPVDLRSVRACGVPNPFGDWFAVWS